MFKNKNFPSDLRLPIKDLASTVNTALTLIHGGRTCLRFAFQLATQDQAPLCDGLVDDILHLYDFLARCYAPPYGARWIRETLRDATAPHRPDRTASSGSDSSTAPGQRHREDPSSGRGNSKRAILSGNSDSDTRPPPRRTGHDRRSNGQVPPRVYYAAEHDDSDTPPFFPRTFRRREHAQHQPSGIAATCANLAPGVDSPPSMQHMVEAITAAIIATVDRHLAHLGLYPRSEPASSHDFVNPNRPPAASASVATPPPLTGSVAPTTHPAAALTNNAYPLAVSASIATPPPLTGSVAPTTHLAAALTNNVYPLAATAPEATPPPLADPVAPTTHPTAVSNNAYAFVAPAPVTTLLPPADFVAPTANPAPAPSRIARPPVTSFTPALDSPLASAPADERILYDDSSSQVSTPSSSLGLRADFVTSLQAAYRTLDMRRVPRVQPLQFPPSADRIAATQLLIHSMRNALSGSFDVTDPTGTVTINSPVWVPGWHTPLLKRTKTAINPNRDDTHDLNRLVDDLFSQLQNRITTGSSGPAAFKILLADFADCFDRAPRGAALETLQKFGVRTGTPFSSYLRALRVVVASTVEKGGPLAPSAAMAIVLALSAILASDDPREQKRLGRKVRHFDHKLWQSECENIVLHGNLAKFSKNEEMQLALIQTGDRRLAEASPHDNLWGIGLGACDLRASSPDSWCGQNLLVQALEYA